MYGGGFFEMIWNSRVRRLLAARVAMLRDGVLVKPTVETDSLRAVGSNSYSKYLSTEMQC